MKQKQKEVRVIFYHEKDSDGVFAYFPDEQFDSVGNKLCYSHVGQHSGCSPKYVTHCTLARPDQYQTLKEELEKIGYKLSIKDNQPRTLRKPNMHMHWIHAVAGAWLGEQPEVVQATLHKYVHATSDR